MLQYYSPIDCQTGSTPYDTILVTRPTIPPVTLPSVTVTPTIDPPHTDTAPDNSSTDIVSVIMSGRNCVPNYCKVSVTVLTLWW